ncbi:MAG: hypothetical protein EAZ64_02420 [Sphingobacteriales bacterium]|nr:MAG: hypothetical protein EAZ64_02420 [Sphingobacteriales bacterium]
MQEKFNASAKYNFWNGNVPQQGFLRTYYLNTILGFCHNKLVKVIEDFFLIRKSYLSRLLSGGLICTFGNKKAQKFDKKTKPAVFLGNKKLWFKHLPIM